VIAMTDWMMNQAAECDPNWPENSRGKPMPTPPRFFLAHAKSCDDEELDQLVAACSALLDRLSGGKPFNLVLGRAYYEERWKAAGSWEAWTDEIAMGLDYATRAPLFAAIFIPAGPVGAATAAIIRKAIVVGRPCFAFDAEGKSARVTGVRTVDSKNWQGGFRLVCAKALE
jgi:hypothetical protein